MKLIEFIRENKTNEWARDLRSSDEGEKATVLRWSRVLMEFQSLRRFIKIDEMIDDLYKV